MEIIELNAKVRTNTGNGAARSLRREGKIPAVLYGRDTESVSLSVDIKELETALKKGSIGQSLFNLQIQNGDTYSKTVMIKELQYHPLSLNFLHADFYEIAMDRKITVNVPVVTVGKSKGVEMGGILQIIRRELEVTCLPTQIPESIEIDITELEIGDSIHAEEIPLSEGVEIITEVNFTVVTVLAPKIEEEEVEEEAEEAEEGAEETAEAEETETTEE